MTFLMNYFGNMVGYSDQICTLKGTNLWRRRRGLKKYRSSVRSGFEFSPPLRFHFC